jgi:hypothetical protein
VFHLLNAPIVQKIMQDPGVQQANSLMHNYITKWEAAHSNADFTAEGTPEERATIIALAQNAQRASASAAANLGIQYKEAGTLGAAIVRANAALASSAARDQTQQGIARERNAALVDAARIRSSAYSGIGGAPLAAGKEDASLVPGVPDVLQEGAMQTLVTGRVPNANAALRGQTLMAAGRLATAMGLPQNYTTRAAREDETTKSAMSFMANQNARLAARLNTVDTLLPKAIEAAKKLGLDHLSTSNTGILLFDGKAVPTDDPKFADLQEYITYKNEVQKEYAAVMSIGGNQSVAMFRASLDVIKDNAGVGIQGTANAIKTAGDVLKDSFGAVSTVLNNWPSIRMVNVAQNKPLAAKLNGMVYIPKDTFQKSYTVAKEHNPALTAEQYAATFIANGLGDTGQPVYIEGMMPKKIAYPAQ